MSESLLLFMTAAALIIFAQLNPQRFLFFMGMLANVPTIAPLYLLKIVIQRVILYNVRMLEEGRFTLWFKIFTSMQLRIVRLEDYLFESINWFLGERGKGMIKISKGKSTVEYVPVSERGDDVENPAKVVVKRLTRARLAQIRDGLLGFNKRGSVTKVRNNSVRLQITMESIVSLENFSLDGTPLVFDPSNREEIYELIPSEIAQELEERFGDGELDYEAVEARIAEAEAKAEKEAEQEAEEDAADDESIAA